MTMKIGFRMTTMMTRLNTTMENTMIEQLREVEYPRAPKGRTWMPIDEQAKRERKWVDIEDLTKKKECTWIPMEVE